MHPALPTTLRMDEPWSSAPFCGAPPLVGAAPPSSTSPILSPSGFVTMGSSGVFFVGEICSRHLGNYLLGTFAVAAALLLCLRASARGPSPGAPFLALCYALLVVLLLHGALAACPGASAPGYYCMGAVETLCPAGAYCIGDAASAPPCTLGSFCYFVAAQPNPCAAGYYDATVKLTSPTCTGACSAAPGSGCAAGSILPTHAKQCALRCFAAAAGILAAFLFGVFTSLHYAVVAWRLFSGVFACGGCIGAGALPASRAALLPGLPPLLLRLCALALLLESALAGCPGDAMPGSYCVGSVETPCPMRSYCVGGSSAATPCIAPENCASAGLSAEPPSYRHLAMSVTCTNVIPQSATNYGIIPTSGIFFYCTSATGSSYINNAFQVSRHMAPPGYRIVLAITQWSTEFDYDYGRIFLTNSGASPSFTSRCSATEVASGGIPLTSGGTAGAYAGTLPGSGSPLASSYGGSIGLCFFSDNYVSLDGIGYSITAEACPAGYFCQNDALSPTPCGIVRSYVARKPPHPPNSLSLMTSIAPHYPPFFG